MNVSKLSNYFFKAYTSTRLFSAACTALSVLWPNICKVTSSSPSLIHTEFFQTNTAIAACTAYNAVHAAVGMFLNKQTLSEVVTEDNMVNHLHLDTYLFILYICLYIYVFCHITHCSTILNFKDIS